MTAHIGRCGVCRAFQEEAEAFTSLLRSAPLEPVPWPVTGQARVPGRRVRYRALAQIASVASVVVVAGSIAIGHERPFQASGQSAVAAQGADPVLADEAIRMLRREALTEGALQILPVAGAPSSASPAGTAKPALPVEGR